MTEDDRAFVERVRTIAIEVAAANADEVDRESRFPRETIDALRAVRALSAFIPTSHGGDGLSFTAIARACEELARRCSASGMVFAMHQIKLGSVVRHAIETPFFAQYLRDVAAQQRLIASITSEVGVGGDMRSSVCAVEVVDDDTRALTKQATTISYGAHCDDLFATARRAPDAEASDQVLVLLRRADTGLEQTATWDSLGMRGTCSPGFVVSATFPAEHIVPAPFATIAAESMVPWSHILWSHVWVGIAGEAFERARAFVRASARRSPGVVPATAGRLSELSSVLAQMRAEVEAVRDGYVVLMAQPDGASELQTLGYAIRINNLKIGASERTAEICHGALQICGMAGYKNDSPFSIGRQLRDSLSAALMVGNDRIHATNARLWLVHKAD